MGQQSVPAVADVIRLEGVTKAYQADAWPALADVRIDVAPAVRVRAAASRWAAPSRSPGHRELLPGWAARARPATALRAE